MKIQNFTKENFEKEVLHAKKTVLVDFWAPWCGPCRAVAPIIDQVAEETAERVKVGKVNVDDEPELAARYGVMSIPTLLVVKDGQIVKNAVGTKSKQEILDMLS
ncbi:thioredoxin [Zongyangia sp. HA2173]|uniref:thioredoxin n=1 Tax=Zongyangia sp. HA2173 TaxID=3133035 RepID=UPI0031669A81